MELGTLYGRRNNLPLAIENLQRAVQLDGDHWPDAHVNLGVALRRSGRIEEAAHHLRKALELDPSLMAAHLQLGLLTGEQGKLSEAVEHFRAALQLDPRQVQTRINLAVALIQLQRPDEALAQLRASLQQDPDLPIALSYTSELLAKMGRLPECVELLAQAVERKPQIAPLRLQLARYLEQAAQPAKALEQYREAERLERGNLQALSRIAWILSTDPDSKLRNGAEAVRQAQRANDKSQRRNVAILDVLAAAHAEVGDFAEAVATAELAQKIALENNQPRDAEAVARRLALYRQGKPYRTPQL
jgi:tetratricopeptide (TPR) repeat protein